MALVVERLRDAREQNGWSQRELARLCGLGELQIHRYETGTTDPSTDNLRTIAEKLGVSTDFLLGLSNVPQGQLGDQLINDDERAVLETFRREGWQGVARLSVEKLSER